MIIGSLSVNDAGNEIRMEKGGYGVIIRESGISFIDEGREVSFEDFFRELANMQFVPLIESEWIQVDENEWKCSRCGNEIICDDYTPEDFEQHYCYQCGAKMTVSR